MKVDGKVSIGVLKVDWGWLGLARTERGLCGLTLPEPTATMALERIAYQCPTATADGDFEDSSAGKQLQDYFSGERTRFNVKLDLPLEPTFWRKVWEVVAAIPYGDRLSYGDVAQRAGNPKAARAVGGAMAHNPVPIIVPCHRVVGSDGRLVGFGGGLELKHRMLNLEAKGQRIAPSGM